MNIIDYTKPIEYIDGSEARYLGSKDGDHKVTPKGRIGSPYGNYYTATGKHLYGEYDDIRNKVEGVEGLTDEALVKQYREADTKMLELMREVLKRGFVIIDEGDGECYPVELKRIYKSVEVDL